MKADNQIYEWRETMKPKALSNINGMESQSDVSPWQGGKKEGSTPIQSRNTKPPENQEQQIRVEIKTCYLSPTLGLGSSEKHTIEQDFLFPPSTQGGIAEWQKYNLKTE